MIMDRIVEAPCPHRVDHGEPPRRCDATPPLRPCPSASRQSGRTVAAPARRPSPAPRRGPPGSAAPSRSTSSPVSSVTSSGAHAGRERDVPAAVGVRVVPRHAVVARLGEQRVAVVEPLPHGVRRRQHVVLAQPHVRQAGLLQHVGTDAVGAEHDAVRARGRPRVADGVVHVAARVVGDRAGQVAVEVHAVHQPPVVAGERAPAAPPPRCRRGPRRRGCARRRRGPRPARRRRRSVSSVHVNAACTPTMPRPPARRKRSFSARPRRAPSAP